MTFPYSTYRQAILTPFGWTPTRLNEDGQTVLDIQTLTWVLRGDVLTGRPPLRYVCMNGLAENLREEDCSTPGFSPDYVDANALPSEVLDYMERFSHIWMAGAAWGRAKFPKPCPELPL